MELAVQHRHIYRRGDEIIREGVVADTPLVIVVHKLCGGIADALQETALHLTHDDVVVHGRTNVEGGIGAQNLGKTGVGIHLHLNGLRAPGVGGIGVAPELIQIEGDHEVRLDELFLDDLILAVLPLGAQLDRGAAQQLAHSHQRAGRNGRAGIRHAGGIGMVVKDLLKR